MADIVRQSNGGGRQSQGRVDKPAPLAHRFPMSHSPSSDPTAVVVRAVPIELCQFLKFGGLAETGGAAKQVIGAGQVQVNGAVETRKRKQLAAGDHVTFAGRTIVVQVA